jgi:sortase A
VIRKLGFAMLGAGVLFLIWCGVTVWIGDPVTSLYTRYEQHGLAIQLAKADRTWAPQHARLIASERAVAKATRLRAAARLKLEASAYELSLKNGAAVGRIVIPRIGLKMVVVEGTTESDLARGPGHYDLASGEATGLPGMGGVIAIAGHRTTYLHPFRHIDDLHSGNQIYLVMPYGTFRYTVYRHEVVSSTDWSILRRNSFEELVLSACHPLYSATHRWVVFARLTSPTPVV